MAQKAKDIEDILNDFSQELSDSMHYSYHVTQFLENEPQGKKTEIPLDHSPRENKLEKPQSIKETPHPIKENPPIILVSDPDRNREISFNFNSKNLVPTSKPQNLLVPNKPSKMNKNFDVDRPRTYMDTLDSKNINFVPPKKVTQVLNNTHSYNQVTLAEKNFRATRKITQKLETLKKDIFVHKITDAKSQKVIMIQEEEIRDSEYNPYLVPYRLDLALLHEKASKFGLEDEESDELKTEEKELMDVSGKAVNSSVISLTGVPKECPCCYESLEKHKTNLCFSSEDVRFLGHGFPLYMTLIKALIFLILIPFVLLVFVPHAVFLSEKCDSKNQDMMLWSYCEPREVLVPDTNETSTSSSDNSSRLMVDDPGATLANINNIEITNNASSINSSSNESNANSTENEDNNDTNGEHEVTDETDIEIVIINDFLFVIEERLNFDLAFLIYFVLVATGLRIYGLRYIRKHNTSSSLGQFTILVKNVPLDCEEDEIRDFFQSQQLDNYRSWLNRKLGLEDNLLPEGTKAEISEINFVYNFGDLIACNTKIMSLIKTRRKLLAIYSNIKRNNSKGNSFGSIQDNYKSSFQGSFQGSFTGDLPATSGPDAINEEPPIIEKKQSNYLNNGSFDSNYEKNSSLLIRDLKKQAEDSKKSFIWDKIEAGTLFLERHLKVIDQEIISQHELQHSIIKGLKENTAKELEMRFCGQVFVSFSNSKVAMKMVQIFRALYDVRKRKFRGEKRLIVEAAANPEEIIWENLGIYSHKKIYIRLFTFTLELMMLALTTFIVFLIYNEAESEELTKECGIAILVLTINKLFMILISRLVEHERHKTKATVEALVVMFTLPLTLVNILVFELVDYGNIIIARQCITKDNDNLWEMGKITHKLLFVNIFASIGEPALSFIFDYTHFSKLYHRMRIKMTQGYKNYCQEEVNKFFEGSEIELHEYYSHTCISFCLGMFAAPFFPPSILIVIGGLGLNYWLLKYNMLYRCKVESHQCNRVIGYFLLLVNLGPIFYMVSLLFISFYSVACKNETDADAALFEKYEFTCLGLLVFLCFTLIKWIRPMIFWRLDVTQKSLGELKKEKTRTYDHLKSLLKQK